MAFALTANRREVFGRKTKILRRTNRIPAVLYGHGVAAQPLEVDVIAFRRVYAQAKESSLVDLTVGTGQAVKVIIQDVQLDPLRGKFLHVDFHQVRMTEKIETEIALTYVGESPAVKEQAGILMKNFDAVKISALPGDLVKEIPVDISRLKTFEDAIHIRDLAVPPGIKVLDPADEIVAKVAPPRSEAELEALEEKVEANVEAVEVVGKKEKEEATEAAAEDEGAKKEE